jgi:hypothetical protein
MAKFSGNSVVIAALLLAACASRVDPDPTATDAASDARAEVLLLPGWGDPGTPCAQTLEVFCVERDCPLGSLGPDDDLTGWCELAGDYATLVTGIGWCGPYLRIEAHGGDDDQSLYYDRTTRKLVAVMRDYAQVVECLAGEWPEACVSAGVGFDCPRTTAPDGG